MQFFQGDLFMYILLNNHLTKKQLGKTIRPFSWLNRFTDPLLSHVYGIESPFSALLSHVQVTAISS